MRFLIATTMTFLAFGCASDPSNPSQPGELGYLVYNAEWIHPAGNFVYYNYEGSLYVMDATNPRRPKDLGRTGSVTIGCCQHVAFAGDLSFWLGTDELQRMTLHAIQPATTYLLPVSEDYTGETMVARSETDYIIGRTRSSDITGDLVRIDDYDQIVVTQLEVDFPAQNLALSGDYLVTYHDAWTNSQELVVYYAPLGQDPVEHARFPLDHPQAQDLRAMAVNGRQVVLVARESNATYSRVTWYELGESYDTLTEVATTEEFVVGSGQPAIVGDYVLVNSRGRAGEELNEHVLTLHLDRTNGTLEEVFRVLGRDSGGNVVAFENHGEVVVVEDIVVDEPRGLVYVGGFNLQILDLGVITDGTPRWP